MGHRGLATSSKMISVKAGGKQARVVDSSTRKTGKSETQRPDLRAVGKKPPVWGVQSLTYNKDFETGGGAGTGLQQKEKTNAGSPNSGGGKICNRNMVWGESLGAQPPRKEPPARWT